MQVGINAMTEIILTQRDLNNKQGCSPELPTGLLARRNLTVDPLQNNNWQYILPFVPGFLL